MNPYGIKQPESNVRSQIVHCYADGCPWKGEVVDFREFHIQRCRFATCHSANLSQCTRLTTLIDNKPSHSSAYLVVERENTFICEIKLKNGDLYFRCIQVGKPSTADKMYCEVYLRKKALWLHSAVQSDFICYVTAMKDESSLSCDDSWLLLQECSWLRRSGYFDGDNLTVEVVVQQKKAAINTSTKVCQPLIPNQPNCSSAEDSELTNQNTLLKTELKKLKEERSSFESMMSQQLEISTTLERMMKEKFENLQKETTFLKSNVALLKCENNALKLNSQQAPTMEDKLQIACQISQQALAMKSLTLENKELVVQNSALVNGRDWWLKEREQLCRTLDHVTNDRDGLVAKMEAMRATAEYMKPEMDRLRFHLGERCTHADQMMFDAECKSLDIRKTQVHAEEMREEAKQTWELAKGMLAEAENLHPREYLNLESPYISEKLLVTQNELTKTKEQLEQSNDALVKLKEDFNQQLSLLVERNNNLADEKDELIEANNSLVEENRELVESYMFHR